MNKKEIIKMWGLFSLFMIGIVFGIILSALVLYHI